MQKILFKNITVVNEFKKETVDVLVEGERISRIDPRIQVPFQVREINGEGKLLLPGVIDDQVHFREPGLTHKATIATESAAAAAGGVTSFMEMPNTIPNALTLDLLEDKYRIATATSAVNYSFYMGVSNTNAEEVLKVNRHKEDICGVKIFMGSSTGNMLVNDPVTLNRIFAETEMLIATHCEDETRIQRNLQQLLENGIEPGPAHHPVIRDAEACYLSSLYAVQLATKHQSRLHILHISTADELPLFGNMMPLQEKRITTEVCVHHLHFTADDYARLGYAIKCNPAIKAPHHRDALWGALKDDRLDVIATDHAPHLWSEKQPPYDKAHAGLPLVQHALPLMLYYVEEGKIRLEQVVHKMSHAVATCFNIKDRGFIREGYYADLVVVNNQVSQTVSKDNIRYKCGWSPLEGFTFPHRIESTFVNGQAVYDNGSINRDVRGMRLKFNR
ncbi:MAG TPA: dihydroorotase [Chitinophagaceae bacterium]|nr:dihydroorotase [Chitinophagaceae bacterium]HML57430.1 dihydroorotase [Ferruginibacter sp.]